MNPERWEQDRPRWERLKEVFAAAIETPAETRDTFIEQSCGFDAELKAEIRRLMEEYFAAGRFLSDSAVDLDDQSLAERPPRFSPSTVLARRFRIVRFIARGGMGEVYEAEDLELGERVALKTIRADIAADERMLGLFKHEIQLARRVTHPNVCRIFDLAQHSEPGPDGAEEVVHFLTMELLEGQALSRYLKENGAFSPAEALPLIEQMAAALQAAHDAGVIHRDFKPGNVVLIRRGNDRGNGNGFRIVVTDFGLALPLVANQSEEEVIPEHRAGTPEYMAPEQIEGGPITPAADLYSFGLVIAETVGGKKDTDEVSRLRTLLRTRAAREEAPLSLPVSCRSWKPVLRRCLERVPERRFSTPVEVVEALRSANLRGRPVVLWKLAAAIAILIAAMLALQPVVPDQLRIPWLARLVTRWSGQGGIEAKGSSAAPLDFRKRDWVLITHFENRTGEKAFDGTLEYALERELSNSRYVIVVPRQRVEDTLALMRKPADTLLDSALGREVCLRDGIRAMVNGRIERLGSTYQLSSVIVEPVRGVAVASQAEVASSEAEVLGAVRRLSAWARERLGETPSAIEESTQALEKVSTQSLRALQLYSLADDDIRHSRFREAELLLREALQLDPAFASAEILLAWAIRNQGRPDSDYLPHGKRAFELSAGCPARERYFISGSYYWMKGMMEKAREQYETLVQVHPDHYWANYNLAVSYQESGYVPESIALWRRLSELRPGSWSFLGRMGDAELRYNGDLERAREAAAKIRQLRTAETEEAGYFDKSQFCWADMLAFHEHWQAGRIDQAAAELRRLAASIDHHHPSWRVNYAIWVAGCSFSLGQIRQAQQVSRYVPEYFDDGSRSGGSIGVAFALEDPALVRSSVERYLSAPNPGLSQEGMVLALVRAGYISRAEAAVRAVKQPDLSARKWQTVRGEIALARGDLDGAIRLLREALEDRLWIWYPHYFMGCESLARALRKKGQLTEAIRVLEDASRAKRKCYNLWTGHVGLAWLRNQEQLAQLYREAGRTTEAAAIEDDLRHMLSRADPDFPLLIRLNRLRQKSAARPPG